MKYAAEMGSGTMIYIPSFTKIGSEPQSQQGGYLYADTILIFSVLKSYYGYNSLESHDLWLALQVQYSYLKYFFMHM
jgi:hypothetical protein